MRMGNIAQAKRFETIQRKNIKEVKKDLTRFLDKKVKVAWRSAIGIILMSGSLRRLGASF
jgi:hypothetical protein